MRYSLKETTVDGNLAYIIVDEKGKDQTSYHFYEYWRGYNYLHNLLREKMANRDDLSMRFMGHEGCCGVAMTADEADWVEVSSEEALDLFNSDCKLEAIPEIPKVGAWEYDNSNSIWVEEIE